MVKKLPHEKKPHNGEEATPCRRKQSDDAEDKQESERKDCQLIVVIVDTAEQNELWLPKSRLLEWQLVVKSFQDVRMLKTSESRRGKTASRLVQ